MLIESFEQMQCKSYILVHFPIALLEQWFEAEAGVILCVSGSTLLPSQSNEAMGR